MTDRSDTPTPRRVQRLAAVLVTVAALVSGCGKDSDDKRFHQAVKKVATSESDAIDVRAFPQIKDADLELTGELMNLRTVILDNSPVTDKGIEILSKNTVIETLSLSNTRVTDAGMVAVGTMHNLVLLRLDRVRVSDAGVEHLKKLRNLKHLSLWKVNLTDKGVLAILSLKDLEHLSLDETQITDAGVKELAELPNLNYLSIWKCRITDGAVTALKSAKPKLTVNR